MEPEGVQFLLVRAAEHWFAIETGQVESLRRRETLYPPREDVPHLVGLLPAGRGSIPVVDLGSCLGLAPRPNRGDRLILIGEANTTPLAFLVQGVSGPVLVPWTAIHSLPPLLLHAQQRPVVWGLIEHQHAWLPALDLALVLTQTDVEALQAYARAYQGGWDDTAFAA
ncbi:MAG: chemotaxis protein CheW [Chloroflexia bacterium]